MSASFKNVLIMIKRILFVFSALLCLAACEGLEGGGKGKIPNITLAPGEVIENTLTFDVTVNDAIAAAYMCVPASSATPEPATVLEKGKAVTVGQTSSITVYSLDFEAAYTIVVAAMDEADNIVSETLSMTTAEQSLHLVLTSSATTHKSFVFTLTPTNADAVYYKMYVKGETATNEDIIANGESVSATEATSHTLTPEKGDYFVAAVATKGDKAYRAKDLEFSIAGAEVVNVEVKRVDAKNYGTDILYDIYLKNSDINVIKLDCYFHDGSTSAFGEYVYSNKSEPGKVAHSYSYSTLLSGTRIMFTGGTVKVEDAGSGQHKIIVNMTREDEKVYDFTWVGDVQWK